MVEQDDDKCSDFLYKMLLSQFNYYCASLRIHREEWLKKTKQKQKIATANDLVTHCSFTKHEQQTLLSVMRVWLIVNGLVLVQRLSTQFWALKVLSLQVSFTQSHTFIQCFYIYTPKHFHVIFTHTHMDELEGRIAYGHTTLMIKRMEILILPQFWERKKKLHKIPNVWEWQQLSHKVVGYIKSQSRVSGRWGA